MRSWLLITQLAQVDLGDPTQAEFSHIERTVQGWLRRVGGILCARWALGAADVLAARPTCPGCHKVMAISHRTAVQVSNLRTKEPGMRWSHGGMQEILTLRALRLSAFESWNFASAPQTRRPPVRSLTYAATAPAEAA
ncbi:MAG: hypothetical protein K6V73_06515 [Firmicutes bacterium]|nr:hypothetical protein [Bacillota bacterium]